MNNLLTNTYLERLQYWKAPKEVIKLLTCTRQKGEIRFQYIDWRILGC